MHNRLTLAAFSTTVNDGLSFPLQMDLGTGVDVTPDFVNWVDIYSQSGVNGLYNKAVIRGTTQAITLGVTTTQGGLLRKVVSDPFGFEDVSGWLATASGATFNVSPNFWVGFKVFATKQGVSSTTITNQSNGGAVLDTFTSTVGATPPPPEFSGEFSAYGTGWRWAFSAKAGSTIGFPSSGAYQQLYDIVDEDPNGDLSSLASHTLHNLFYHVWNDLGTSPPKSIMTLRPSALYGAVATRAQTYINAFPSGYVKVYAGPPATNGSQVRTFATKNVLPGNSSIVRFYAASPGPYQFNYPQQGFQQFPDEYPIRVEFYTA